METFQISSLLTLLRLLNFHPRKGENLSANVIIIATPDSFSHLPIFECNHHHCHHRCLSWHDHHEDPPQLPVWLSSPWGSLLWSFQRLFHNGIRSLLLYFSALRILKYR